ncbi:alcohol dehydrogenase catalytic domain-containing protein [Desulfosarcina ovata]|uniref:Alcohol dehydrogenase n=1 Tax=Desulfosarcina ovata subsp. ovata TaxID=2752305 RepID=A0A5K8ACE6_9BACT|nr:alcohol dehydrogenase catalytic domain-containing protein [Desulfosarcina ovata]BBO90138.1 alcohol dehydrogenase [Desulfosarcina ovata subsp. ovata]
MKIVLTGLEQIETQPADQPAVESGMTRLAVRYCGICRTDAKMWHEGHRDLIFPRVPGHEVLAEDEHGQRFTVWPGRICGRCRYCTSGRENLCESMQIMGFHFDGGFSRTLLAPTESLIPVPDTITPHQACFAEPVGCVHNALTALNLQPGERVVVFGGGTVGLIAALVAKTQGAIPLVIEKNARKIARAGAFLGATQITALRETHESEFDAAINACPDPIAFSQAVTKLAKGGRLSFFSGLKKNQTIESNLINLLHYREAALFGAYGLTRQNMVAALGLIARHQPALEHLVEAIVPPEQLSRQLPRVLAGDGFKVILDFTGKTGRRSAAPPPPKTEAAVAGKTDANRLFQRK